MTRKRCSTDSEVEMGNLKVNFDEQAEKAVGLAKALARGEGDRRLGAVHVVKAAWLAFPEDAARHFRQVNTCWSEVLWDFVAQPDGFRAESDRMPVTRELAGIVRRLDNSTEVVTLERLLKVILAQPSVRVKALLCQVGGAALMSGHGTKGNNGAGPHYLSKRDWLEDLRAEWRLRKSAARACGLPIGFGDHDFQSKPYASDTVLNVVARTSAMNREKAKASPARHDPLATFSVDLASAERAACEAFVVDCLYGLDVHPLPGLSARDLAQMLDPENYPANCRGVLDAVERLEELSVITWHDSGFQGDLTERVCLSQEAKDQILQDLARDGISAGEARAMKRRLRHGADWEATGG